MLGMMLAHRLRAQGKTVTLIEASPSLGGLASAWRLGDVMWDRHYHVTLLSDTHTRKIIAELGLENEMHWVTTRTGCYSDGQLYSVSNAVEFLKFPPLQLVDKFRLAATILYAARTRNWQELERVSVSEWLTRWSGQRTFERFWLPLLRSKLGNSYRDTSAAFIWATIQRLYAARRTGLKREMFGYVSGGYARILDNFTSHLQEEGVTIRVGQPVTGIETVAGRSRVRFKDGKFETFDHVILTTAAPLAARLCPSLSSSERARLEKVRYLGIACASLLLRRPLGGFYVTNITDEGFPFTGIIEMTTLVSPSQFGGRHLVYLPRYLAPEDKFAALDDSEIRNQFIDGLTRMYPEFRESDVLTFRVSRVRFVMPIPCLGYSDLVLPFDTSVPGIHLVNSSQIQNGTLNVNETIALAERAANHFAQL